MGTKVHCKSYLPGFYTMRDLNEDSSSSSWPLFHGDKTIPNGQYHNGFMPRISIDGYQGRDKDTLKQKMLEHESVFKNQVCELHRLYRIQRDMMEEVKRKEPHKHRPSMEAASSSSLQGCQVPYEDARKWHMAGFSLLNSSYGRTLSGVEALNSPMSCSKRNTIQPGHFPFENGSTSKDYEALDPRPLKVRKKLFDLQLPADGYTDTEEGRHLKEYKGINLSSYAPNGNHNSEPETSTKLFFGAHAGMKTDNRLIDASASASCLRGSIGLADLNEPVQVEERIAPSCVDFIGCTSEEVKTKGIDQPAKSNPGYFGVTREAIPAREGFLTNSSSGSKDNERGQFSYIHHKGGSSRGILSSVTQVCQPDKLPLPFHPVQLNQVHPPEIFPSGYCREDLWREGLQHGLESSSRNRDHSNNSQSGPIASQTPGSYPFFNSSSFTTSWPHSVNSWAKPTTSFAQNLTASLSQAASMSRNLGSETTWNGFYHASASGSKKLGFEYLNCSRGDNLVSGRSNSRKGSSCLANQKPAIDINLNEVHSKSPSNDIEILQDLNMTDGEHKPEEHLSALPWLKPKPVHVNETSRDLNQPFTSSTSGPERARKKEIAETQTVKIIPGFPIFERDVQDNEPSSALASTTASVDCEYKGNNLSHGRKNGIIDINVALEPDDHIAAEELAPEKEKQKKGGFIIDLNSFVSDFEDPPEPFCERKSAEVKITLEIDLEVPLLLESEDDNSTLSKENIPNEAVLQRLENTDEQKQDETLRSAAETMIAISSWCPKTHAEDSTSHLSEASLAEALLLFADSLSSHADGLDNTLGKELKDSCEEIDDFEAMTLQLADTKEEDYMPQPFVPEFENMEETIANNNALLTRPRRGQARRGRQRRDFQRDILPGLTSLSRHEVTEDLQTFGGLMRAMGHSWNLGSMRRNGTRNGGARGRRAAVVVAAPIVVPDPVCGPLVQQITDVEGGLEDRSLTGWGKTTRRPRRQRCAAVNPAAITLS